MEVDPKYCDVILRRWADFTGKDPVRQDGAEWSTVKPTSKFGELFQYSNLMAAAAGYVAVMLSIRTWNSDLHTIARCSRTFSVR
jgi:hypothetical protein